MTADTAPRDLAVLAAPVDRSSPLPAWAQVHRDLRTLIDQGMHAGHQLPTEKEMAAIYGISRITVRQALAALAEEGYVQRRQGTGTFVAERPQLVQHDLGLATPWRDRFRAAGDDAQSLHLADHEVEPEPSELVRELSAEEREGGRLHLKRVHLVNRRPIGITDSWIAGPAAESLAGRALIEGSVSKTLASVGVQVVDAHHFLEVRPITHAEAKILTTDGDGLLFVDWSIGRQDGELIETSRTVWLGSRVRFHYTTQGQPAAQ